MINKPPPGGCLLILFVQVAVLLGGGGSEGSGGEVQVQVVRKMIPNPAGTYLIRRALKNDSDPYHECSKRSHERQVMKVFVETVIRRCYEVATKMKGCC